MSWQGYIDNLHCSGHITHAAIVGYPDGQVWAASSGFNLTCSEIKAIAGGFGTDSLASTGILANSTKYFYLQADDCQIQGKKGQCGICVARAGKCMIIGTYSDGHQPGNARKAIESMVDYLRESGY